MVIRPGRATDADAIRDCATSAYARYVASIGRKPAPMVADFDAQIAAGNVHVALGKNETLVGFAVFFPREDHMFLENVAVRPSASGQGTGRSLIAFCEAEAKRLGLSAVELYTNEMMRENLSFYPRLGYEEIARRVEDGFKRVYFRKTLCQRRPVRQR